MSENTKHGNGNLKLALEHLRRLIRTGYEYPDAHWRTCDRFALSARDADRLTAEYDAAQATRRE